jgi:flavin reductase (DIM6/NTAB) family NADH-FMN oxidoreductase RutF
MAIDKDEFRRALGNFLTGVTIITTATDDNEVYGMTANSFNSVSLDPPLVLFSIARNADCFDAFEGAGAFAVNILRLGQDEVSTRFATKNIDKWEGTEFELGDNGCPVLKGAIATFECSVEKRIDGGDHVIYLGRVQAIASEDDAEPLAFFKGRYAKLA